MTIPKNSGATIHVTQEVHRKLCKAGEKGQTFNEIIENLLLAQKKQAEQQQGGR